MGIIDYIFPKDSKCIFCGKETGTFAICDECYKDLPFLKEHICIKCGGLVVGDGNICLDCQSSKYLFERNYSVLIYENEIKSKIINFKQSGKKYVGRAFAEIMLEYFKKISIPFDVIIPMPIHSNRQKQRGFNQSEILATSIKEYYGRVDTDLLIRTIDTPHQTGLSRENRKVNLKDAFKVTDKKKVKGKTVLIVDDIFTTGSTMNECARTLKKAGADKVYGLSLARPRIFCPVE